MNTIHTEHERRFLTRAPDAMRRIRVRTGISILQGYFTPDSVQITPDAVRIHGVRIPLPIQKIQHLQGHTDLVARLRQSGQDAWITFKGPKVQGSGLEVEEEVTSDISTPLVPHTIWLVRKTRVIVPIRRTTVELDRFHGPLDGLFIGEVENPPADWTPPRWLGREITDEPQWSNVALGRFGRPE